MDKISYELMYDDFTFRTTDFDLFLSVAQVIREYAVGIDKDSSGDEGEGIYVDDILKEKMF